VSWLCKRDWDSAAAAVAALRAAHQALRCAAAPSRHKRDTTRQVNDLAATSSFIEKV